MSEDEQVYWIAVIGSLCITVPYVGMTAAVIEYFLRMGDYQRLMAFGGGFLLLSPLYVGGSVKIDGSVYHWGIKGLRDVAKWKEDGFT